MLFETVGNLAPYTPLNYTVGITGGDECCFSSYPTGVHVVSCEGSVVLTQTHPAAPYVCRTGNITLRCQCGGVENVVVVLWIIGSQIASNTSTIPGHTALPPTTTYQEVMVDSYTNLAAGYRCEPILSAMDHCY